MQTLDTQQQEDISTGSRYDHLMPPVTAVRVKWKPFSSHMEQWIARAERSQPEIEKEVYNGCLQIDLKLPADADIQAYTKTGIAEAVLRDAVNPVLADTLEAEGDNIRGSINKYSSQTPAVYEGPDGKYLHIEMSITHENGPMIRPYQREEIVNRIYNGMRQMMARNDSIPADEGRFTEGFEDLKANADFSMSRAMRDAMRHPRVIAAEKNIGTFALGMELTPPEMEPNPSLKGLYWHRFDFDYPAGQSEARTAQPRKCHVSVLSRSSTPITVDGHKSEPQRTGALHNALAQYENTVDHGNADNHALIVPAQLAQQMLSDPTILGQLANLSLHAHSRVVVASGGQTLPPLVDVAVHNKKFRDDRRPLEEIIASYRDPEQMKPAPRETVKTGRMEVGGGHGEMGFLFR